MALDLRQYESRGYLLDEFRMFHLRDTRMERVDWHYHEFHKIIFFLSGQAQYAVEGKRYSLNRGDMVFVPCGCIHRPEIVEGMPYERIVLYISPDFLQNAGGEDCDLARAFSQAKARFEFVLRPGTQQERFLQQLLALEQTILTEGFAKSVLKRALFLQFLVEVSRCLLADPEKQAGSPVFDKKTVEILRYLNRHLTEPLSIDDLSERFFISKYHLMRRFRQETGYTIHNYLTEKRLMLARERIQAGTPVLEACMTCGYQDYSAFCRAYRKLFGSTPSGK